MAKKKSVGFKYEDIIKLVMENVYCNCVHPRLVDYEKAVAVYKTQKESRYIVPYNARDVHTPVYRAMKVLEKSGVVVHIGRYYYPADLYAFNSGLEDFEKNVKLAKDTFAMISGNTFMIDLEPGQDILRVKESATSFFREEKIVKLLYVDDALIIILNDFCDNRYLIYLTNVLKKVYRDQHPDEA